MMGGKKQGMELNGIANLLIILNSEECSFTTVIGTDDGDKDHQCIPLERMSDIKMQLEYLERYMVAYNKAVREGTQTPFWHEILANPKAFPLNNGK